MKIHVKMSEADYLLFQKYKENAGKLRLELGSDLLQLRQEHDRLCLALLQGIEPDDSGCTIVNWNSQENRTPMSQTLSGKRAISEASPFDQWWEIQFIGSVAPAAVVVGLDPAEYDLANLIPLHGGALEPVDQFLLQRCEKTLHARVVKAAMRAAHALSDGAEPGEHRPVLLAGVLAAVVGVQYQPLLITIA